MSQTETVVRPKFSSIMPGFSVADVVRAVEFYEGRLGFRVMFRNGAVFAIVARDGIEISLRLARAGDAPGNGACYIKLKGVDALHDELAACGVDMTHPLKTESYGMRELMITDPDGNTLNFGEPI